MRGEDSDETIERLNSHGFYVTVLSTAGGFLKRRSVTLLIGTQADKVPTVMELLKATAGRRKETVYHTPPLFTGQGSMPMMATTTPIPVEQDVGGVTVFVLDVDSMDKF